MKYSLGNARPVPVFSGYCIGKVSVILLSEAFRIGKAIWGWASIRPITGTPGIIHGLDHDGNGFSVEAKNPTPE